MPFVIRANSEVLGYQYSIDFDEGVIEALEAVRVAEVEGSTDYDFYTFEMNNEDRTPGNGGVDEGYLVGSAIFRLRPSGAALPRDTDLHVLDFLFRVREGASGLSQVSFVDGGRMPGGGPPMTNVLAVRSEETLGPVFVTLGSGWVYTPGKVAILAADRLFLRGDANSDSGGALRNARYRPHAGRARLLTAGPGCPECHESDRSAHIFSPGIQRLPFKVVTDDALPRRRGMSACPCPAGTAIRRRGN